MSQQRLKEIDEAISYYVKQRAILQGKLAAAESDNLFNGIPLFDMLEDKITGTERIKNDLAAVTATINSLTAERTRILQSMGVTISGKPVNVIAIVALVIVALIIVKKIL
jgi:hypothetical protein